MKIGRFRGKPSKRHILWTREARSGNASKRFDDTHFRRWTNHWGYDYDEQTRIDHDRAEESRTQYRCVFRWGTREGKRVEFGDSALSLGSQKIPISFIEIDEAGFARIKAGSTEAVYDLVEVRHADQVLYVTTASGAKKKLDGEKLS